MTYDQMAQAMAERLTREGLTLGTPVVVGKRRGVVTGINPFFYDDKDPAIYLDLEACGRAKVRKRELVRVSSIRRNEEVIL